MSLGPSTHAVGAPDELAAQGVIELVVPRLEETLRFYQRLGFEVVRATGDFVVLRYADVLLFLAEDAGAPAAPRWANLRIVVADVDAVWRRVVAEGLPVGAPPGDRDYGLRDFTLRDPSGFDVRFAQALGR